MEEKRNYLKSKSGITLIALVVTIIVLLILAGVTINLVLGEDGIISKAQQTEKAQKLAEYKDKIEIAKATVAITGTNYGKVPLDDLKSELVTTYGMEVSEIANDSFEVTVLELDDKIVISKSGNSVSIQYPNVNVNTNNSGNNNPGTTNVAVTGVSIAPTTASIKVGEKVSLTATVAPDNAINKNVEFTSSAPTIATVNEETGEVEGIAVGTATITVTTADGGKTATCEVTVEANEPTVSGETTHTATTLSYTWEEISEIAKAISNTNVQADVVEEGEITNDTVAVKVNIEGEEHTIGVGDTKTLTIGSTSYVVRVMGFNHDKLTSTLAYSQEGKTNVYAGISFEFVDFITNASMNTSDINTGGWGASAMYTTVSGYKDEIDTAMTGSSTSSYIKQVEKEYLATYNSATQSTSNDYLWLLACSEIWSTGARYDGGSWVLTEGAYGYAYATEGEQYKYYKMNETGGNSSYSTANNAFKKPSSATGTTNSGQLWWLRSPIGTYSSGFCNVNPNGNSGNRNASNSCGVALGFSI